MSENEFTVGNVNFYGTPEERMGIDNFELYVKFNDVSKCDLQGSIVKAITEQNNILYCTWKEC